MRTILLLLALLVLVGWVLWTPPRDSPRPPAEQRFEEADSAPSSVLQNRSATRLQTTEPTSKREPESDVQGGPKTGLVRVRVLSEQKNAGLQAVPVEIVWTTRRGGGGRVRGRTDSHGIWEPALYPGVQITHISSPGSEWSGPADLEIYRNVPWTDPLVLDLAVPPPWSASGFVVGPKNEPRAQTEVFLLPAAKNPIRGHGVEFPAVSRTSTDSSGRFHFEWVPFPFILLAATNANEFCRGVGMSNLATAIPRLQRPLRDIRIQILAGRALSGMLVDARNEPIGGAQIEFRPRFAAARSYAEHPDLRLFGSPICRLTSDTDGRFTWSHLPAGSHQVVVRHPRFPDWLGRIDETENELRIELLSGHPLRGIVMEDEGRPLAQAQVAFRCDYPPVYRIVHTDENGRFELQGLPATDRGEVKVRALGYLEKEIKAVQVASEVAPLSVRLQPGRVLEGRVFDAQEQPVPYADLELFLARPNAPPRDLTAAVLSDPAYPYASSNAEGRFLFRGLIEGLYHIKAQARGRPEASAMVAANAGQRRLEIVLNNQEGILWRLRGRVTDGLTQRPITEYSMELLRGPHSWVHRILDAQGTFDIPGLYHSKLRVIIQAEGYADWITDELHGVPGETVRRHIELFPLRNLRLQILDRDGKNYAEARLRLRRGNEPVLVGRGPGQRPVDAMVRADSDGRIHLYGLPATHMTLEVFRDRGGDVFTTPLDLGLPAPERMRIVCPWNLEDK